MRHIGVVQQVADGAYRGVCGCGWMGVFHPRKKLAASDADRHAEAKNRCAKVKFLTASDAQDALLRAKIARSLRGSQKRREERAYWCNECSAWHLTSVPARASV